MQKQCESPKDMDFFSKKINLLDFEKINLIGRGSFSSVYLVMKKDTGKYYAMKELKKSGIINQRKKGRIVTEKKIFKDFDSTFVAKMHFAFQTADKIYFILDFVNGGELHTHMIDQEKFSEAKTKFYAAEILVALEALHEAKIIYRDLKPNNILLDKDGHIKLIDFGLSKIEDDSKNPTKSIVGTPNYIAPEVLHRKNHTEMVDWWSYGVIIYEMISGTLPFIDEYVQ
jgi:serine/threonine protein kinase